MATTGDTTKLSLKPMRKTKLAEGVAQQLLDQIEANGLESGARLPSERDLMRELGVGRSTVREALNGLAMLGVVEIRHGHGAFVANPAGHVASEGISSAMAGCRTREIFEARYVMEPSIAALAAERREDEDLHELELVLLAHADAMEQGAATLDPSGDFHVRLAEAARNRAMYDFVQSFIKVIVDRTPMLEEIGGFIEWELEQHRGIYLAVRDARPALAARRMTEHLDGVARYQIRLGMPEL